MSSQPIDAPPTSQISRRSRGHDLPASQLSRMSHGSTRASPRVPLPTISRRRRPLSRTSSNQGPGRHRRSRMPLKEKVESMFSHMKSLKLDLQQFIRGIVLSDKDPTRRHTKRRSTYLFRALQHPEVKQMLDAIAEKQGHSELCELMQKEFDSLIGKPCFGKWRADEDVAALDFDEAFNTIKSQAPLWLSLYESICHNKFNVLTAEENQKKASFQREAFFVTAILLRHRSRKLSNVVSRLIGLLFSGSGVARSILDIASGFGICDTYKPLNMSWKEIAKVSKQTVKTMARSPQATIAYDNYNFLNTVRDHALGSSRAKFINVTTGIIINCPSIPETGLTISMLDTKRPLDLNLIVKAPGLKRDEVSKQISRFFIAEAFCSVFKDTFKDKTSPRPTFPHIRVIPPEKATTVFPLSGIFADEGTIDGTYKVHESLFFEKCGFDSSVDSEDFKERLWIIWGDQKTAAYNRTVKFEQRFSRHPFHKREWLVSPSAFWHTSQAILYLIVRTHFENPKEAESKSTLLHDISYWARTRINRENIKYHDVAPLVKDGFNARILSVLLDKLIARGLVQFDAGLAVRRREVVEEALKSLDGSELLALIDEIDAALFSSAAWNPKPEDDPEYTTFRRYVQEVELFMTFEYAMSHGDVGIIERLMFALPSWFYGAEQFQYGFETLHWCWLLTASSPELKEALLCSGLVNQRHSTTKWKATDLAVEHLNCDISLDMRNHKNSTHDLGATFMKISGGTVYMSKLRRKFESLCSQHTNQAHSRKKVDADIFSLACYLQSEWPCWRNDRPAITRYESPNVPQRGLRLLEGKVMDYNVSVAKGSVICEGGDATMFNDNPQDTVERALDLATRDGEGMATQGMNWDSMELGH